MLFWKRGECFWDDIPGTDFKIAINERLKKQIDTYGLDISDVYIFLEKHKDEIYYVDGEFTIKDRNMLLELKKKDYFINVVSINNKS